MICSHLEAVERLEVATPDFLQFGPLFLHYSTKSVMLWVRANPRPLLLLVPSPPMLVGKSGLGFAVTQSIVEILLYTVLSLINDNECTTTTMTMGERPRTSRDMTNAYENVMKGWKGHFLCHGWFKRIWPVPKILVNQLVLCRILLRHPVRERKIVHVQI